MRPLKLIQAAVSETQWFSSYNSHGNINLILSTVMRSVGSNTVTGKIVPTFLYTTTNCL